MTDYNNLIVYQIYPRSFYDSNGDGIGDLRGIIEKIGYIVDLGVNAIWLCPCYKSPNVDNGYDISDYRDIASEFGTLDDWKELKALLSSHGIKIIMDLVLNHTSDKHFWFTESKKSKDNKYRSYYYWVNSPSLNFNGFLGQDSVWQYEETTNQYYLHTFAKEQPDLNWTNREVRREIGNIVDYWINLGVDGFRCDAIGFISKNFEKNVFINGPKLHDYINELFDERKGRNIFSVGECEIHNDEEIKKICGKNRGELTSIFQFDHLQLFDIEKKNILNALKNVFVKYQTEWQKDDLYGTVFLENHDQTRSLNKYGDIKEYRYQSATMLAGMYILLKGIPFIYQGEEIGVGDVSFNNIKYFNDPISINYYNSHKGVVSEKEIFKYINKISRDNARRPMPWNNKKHGGFTISNPWIETGESYIEINVEKDISSKKSIYSFYQKLISLRKSSKAITLGSFREITKKDDNMFIYLRQYEDEKYEIVCNFQKENYFICPKGDLILSNSDNKSDKLLSYEFRVYKCFN